MSILQAVCVCGVVLVWPATEGAPSCFRCGSLAEAQAEDGVRCVGCGVHLPLKRGRTTRTRFPSCGRVVCNRAQALAGQRSRRGMAAQMAVPCFACGEPVMASERRASSLRPCCGRPLCRKTVWDDKNRRRVLRIRVVQTAPPSEVEHRVRRGELSPEVLDGTPWARRYRCDREGCPSVKPLPGLCFTCSTQRPRTLLRPEERVVLAAA